MDNEVKIVVTADAAKVKAVQDEVKSGFKQSGKDAADEFDKAIQPGMKASGDKAGKSASQAASQSAIAGFAQNSPGMAAAIGAGILAGGPILAAAGAGAAVLTLAGLAATLQKSNPAVTAAWTQFSADAISAGQKASAGMVLPIVASLNQLDAAIKQDTPQFAQLFNAAGKDLPVLTTGLQNLVGNMLPGLTDGLSKGQPVAAALGGIIGDLGTVVGDLGASIGSAAPQAATGLHSLGAIVLDVGQALGTLIDFSSRLTSGALPILASGVGNLLGGFSALLQILGPIAPELGQIAVVGTEAFGAFKLAGAVTTGVDNLGKSLGSAADGLVNLGGKLEDSSLHGTKLGTSLENAALKGAGFAEKAAGLASAISGPLGLALGGVTLALAIFGQNSDEAAQKQAEQANLTKGLANALEQSGGAIDSNVRSTLTQQLATDSNVQSLNKYGVSLAQVQQTLLAGQGAIDRQVQGLQAQQTAMDGSGAAAVAAAGKFGSNDRAVQAQSSSLSAQIDAWNALKNTMPDAIKQAQAYEQAINASSFALGINNQALTVGQNDLESYDSTLNGSVGLYQQHTSAITQYVDAVVGAAGANLSAQQSWEQLDQAVSTAQTAYDSASQGVTNAQHAIVDAGNAVVSARHSEAQAAQSVVDAEYNYNQSIQAETQAQQAVMAARQAAADQLAALQRQVTDQADTVDAAKLRVVQAQQAVDAAGLTNKTLAGLGDPTRQNQAQYQLLLALSQAQNGLNDAQAQAVTLNKQNADAQAAGIDNATGVLAAEQQLAASQHAVGQASLAVESARFSEQQATNAVKDAVYAQSNAELALATAQGTALDAQQKLSDARALDSRTLDINTEAGNRNWQQVEQLYQKNFALSGNVQQATSMTMNQTTALGFNKDAVRNLIDTLGGLNGQNFQFSVTGTPTLDLTQLQAAHYDASNGLFTSATGTALPRKAFATGGQVQGPGGPRDDLVNARLSPGEWVQPADSVDYYGPAFMEAVRTKQLPRYAQGGPVSPTDLGGIFNLDKGLAAGWGVLQSAGRASNAMGLKPQVNLSMPAAGHFSLGAFASLNSYGGGSVSGASGGTPLAAQQYAAGRLGAYGWGSSEMPPLIALWNQESGWNPWAVNPSSGAYGIPQSLGHGHPYDLGDYVAQINWGLDYIQGRYGSPGAAEGHERAFSWYGSGGPVTNGVAGINDKGSELVRLPNGSTVMPAANAASDSYGSDTGTLDIRMTVEPGADSAVATMFMSLVRSGKIQVVDGSGKRIKVG